jgi:hypothetical protein
MFFSREMTRTLECLSERERMRFDTSEEVLPSFTSTISEVLTVFAKTERSDGKFRYNCSLGL